MATSQPATTRRLSSLQAPNAHVGLGEKQEQTRKASPAFKAFAGSIGGLIEACCLQPMVRTPARAYYDFSRPSPTCHRCSYAITTSPKHLSTLPQDTIKTRMQLQPAKYTNILVSGGTIAREEGVRAMWKGLTPFATHLYCKYALRFGTNAFFQSLLADQNGKLDTGRRVLSGLGAGVVEALVIVTPFEVIKIRLQNQHGLDKSTLKYQGPIDALVKTVRNEVSPPAAFHSRSLRGVIHLGGSSNQWQSLWGIFIRSGGH